MKEREARERICRRDGEKGDNGDNGDNEGNRFDWKGERTE